MALSDALFLLSLVLLFVLILYYQYAHAYFRKRGIPTLPPTFPFGNITSIIFRTQSINARIVDIYNALKPKGHAFGGIYFFTVPVFLPISLELIRNILVKDFNHFDDRGIHFDEENDPVSAHLFSLYGEKWKKLRAKLSPAFTAGKIKYMFDTIQECGDIMIEVLEEMMQNDNVIEIKDILARFTTDVIGSCAFGIKCNSLKNSQAEFRVMGNRAFVHTRADFVRNAVVCASPSLAKTLRLGIFPSEVSNFFKNAVQDTIAFREKNKVTRNDFLQLLIKMLKGEMLEEQPLEVTDEKESPLTLNEATAQAFIFFLAGFETTSTSMGFTILELATNQDIQEKARKEVMETLKMFDGKVTHDAIVNLPYMEKILLESLRKYPPAPAYCRKCTKDYQIPGTDVIIPKDMTVLIPTTMAVQRDPEYYPDPELFDPERFSEDNKLLMKESAYLPFGTKTINF
ncbi:Cytochrome P450 [Popillia japonica]|uniref:Cytochrome P450 n=1 Tax=Popillia japonica TaxID=7064 RepID=A0AAW1I6P5_POPJA